jgi:Uncharacterized protein, putative amidase
VAGIRCAHPDLLIERLSQPAAAALIAASGAAVVATGSVEQHGGHLPLGTDAFAAASIAERVAGRLGTVVASLGPAGVAPYHLAWPGTLSLRPATLAAVMVDVCGGLRGAGARRIVVVNWHEGNSPTLRLAADEAQRRARGAGGDRRIARDHAHAVSRGDGVHPRRFDGNRRGARLRRLPGAPGERDRAERTPAAETAHGLFRRPDVYPVLRDFRQIAATGWYGRPERATAARAEQIAEAVADHVVARAREIWEALGTDAGVGAAEGSGGSSPRAGRAE